MVDAKRPTFLILADSVQFSNRKILTVCDTLKQTSNYFWL